MDLYRAGQNLAPIWQPSLQKVKNEIKCQDEALFGSITALAGIHLNLSFIWQEELLAAGYDDEINMNADLDNLMDNQEKWFCIIVPCGENAAALQVQAPGLSQERRLAVEMTQSSFVQFIKTLDEKGFCLPYQRGIDILYSLGHSYSNTEPLRLPFMHWQELKEKWPLFYELGEALRPSLKNIASEFVAVNKGPSAFSAFNDLAAGLWAQLQELGILSCGQSKKTFFKFLSKGARQEKFLGQAVYYGDHQEFWDFVLDYRKSLIENALLKTPKNKKIELI